MGDRVSFDMVPGNAVYESQGTILGTVMVHTCHGPECALNYIVGLDAPVLEQKALLLPENHVKFISPVPFKEPLLFRLMTNGLSKIIGYSRTAFPGECAAIEHIIKGELV